MQGESLVRGYNYVYVHQELSIMIFIHTKLLGHFISRNECHNYRHLVINQQD